MENKKNNWAHSGDKIHNIWQDNKDHLESVAKIAKELATPMGLGEDAYLFGVLHDLGKYGWSFWERLNGLESGLDHWSAGAEAALRLYRNIDVCLAIQGHHIGLQKCTRDDLKKINLGILNDNHPLGLNLTETDLDFLVKCVADDNILIPEFEKDRAASTETDVSRMLRTRMLFSCGVEADFLDTESHFKRDLNGKKYREKGLPLNPKKNIESLLEYIKKLASKSTSNNDLNQLRNCLFKTCFKAGKSQIGLRTLTAPTGLGKTLSMLAYGLNQCETNNLSRIIVVLPFLSIIEQTAKEYREIFKEQPFDYIVEHHSLSSFFRDEWSAENNRLKLLSENWDAPIIITTDVQFYESLFSNKPSSCRKLHNIFNSMIMFDEVQKTPLDNVCQILSAVSTLHNEYKCSILFSTATQPAFNNLNDEVKTFTSKGHEWKTEEIVPDSFGFFEKVAKKRNLSVYYSKERDSWAYIANRISKKKECLCIVNIRKHASDLYDMVKTIVSNEDKSGIYHISTNMSPMHRISVVNKIKSIQKENIGKSEHQKKRCVLISTQCVEAGVDIDFQYVYRHLSPFDSIAQAAGRCNRNCNYEKGYLWVFNTVGGNKQIPPGYETPLGVTDAMLTKNNNFLDINSQTMFNNYYSKLYSLSDVKNKNPELNDAIWMGDFEKVKEKMRIINNDTIDVLVPYDINAFEKLLESLENFGINKKWITKSRPHSVSIFEPGKNDSIWNFLEPITKNDNVLWYILKNNNYYDQDTGIVLDTN